MRDITVGNSWHKYSNVLKRWVFKLHLKMIAQKFMQIDYMIQEHEIFEIIILFFKSFAI